MRSLTDSQWERVWALVEELRDLTPPKREAALAKLQSPQAERQEDHDVLSLVALQLRLPRDAACQGERVRSQRPTGWSVGEKIAHRWEVKNILGGPGESGMGIVYVVYDHEWHRVFAAKTFQDRFLSSKVARERFLREATVWCRFDPHPNIVRARLVEPIQGKPYVFLDLVTGGDLSNWIGTDRLTLARVLRFSIQFCHGMEYALQHGIHAHRDIKPANCLITDNESLQITDFGLASVSEQVDARDLLDSNYDSVTDSQSGVSDTGVGFGTPRYMAPEQFTDATHVDSRADIYSFGVMLYEMITEKPLFDARGWNEWRRGHESAPVPEIEKHSNGVEVLNHVVRKCLRKDPSSRYQSFEALRSELELIMKRVTAEPVPVPQFASDFDAHELNSKGSSLNYVKQYDEARAVLQQALEKDPDNAMIWNNLGFSFWKLGRLTDALRAFDRALSLQPCHFNALTNKGVLLYEHGGLEESLVLGKRAVEANPSSTLAWNNLGRGLHAAKRYEQARQAYDKALQIEPGDKLTLGNIGYLLANQHMHKEAIEWFDRVLSVDPLDAETLNAKGLSLARCGQTDDAVAHMHSAVHASPGIAVLHANLGKIYMQDGQTEKAKEAFDEALRIAPGNQEVRWLRSECRSS